MPGIRTLKTGVSGVRGVVGDSLTPHLLVSFAEAFGTYLRGGLVAIGRDTRPSGEMVRSALVGGLLATQCSVVDLGIVPVPTLQIACARDPDIAGGIAITASHNPQQWNALKFIRADGIFLYPHQVQELLNVYHQGEFALAGNEQIGDVTSDDEAIDRHVAELLAATDREVIARAKLKVVVDCCNGAGSVVSERLLTELGCEVIAINDTPDGIFPHMPEPVPENLGQLAEAVREHGADIGMAQDADADRLALVDEQGRAVGEEFTLALAAEVVAAGAAPLPLVTNIVTSRMLEEVAERHNCSLHRAPVGEIYVVEAMQQAARDFRAAGHTDQDDYVFGGEGNGGVIDPRIHYCRDSLRAMCLILEGLARRGGPLSSWITETFEPSVIIKERIDCPAARIQPAVLALRREYAEEKIDETDGILVKWPDRSWVQARPSNTEPIMRVAAEADTREQAQALADRAMGVIRRAIG